VIDLQFTRDFQNLLVLTRGGMLILYDVLTLEKKVS